MEIVEIWTRDDIGIFAGKERFIEREKSRTRDMSDAKQRGRINVGYMVEIWTRTGKGFSDYPDRGHVGIIKSIDKHGIQITDRFIPWTEITAISAAEEISR